MSNCTALIFLRLSCTKVTDEGMHAVSSLPALTSLDISHCDKITDVGVRAVSGLPALKFLDLTCCCNVTAAGVQALRSSSTAPSLHIEWYPIEEEDSEDGEDGEDGEDWE